MTTLLDRHDVLLVDLDGTLYRGQAVVPGAVAAVCGATRRGVRTIYVTNNAARRPAQVAAHLSELGYPAVAADVRTSAQAGATMLAEQLPAGVAVLVVGTSALAEQVTDVGLSVTGRAESAVAVIQGHSPQTAWSDLAEATVALRAGAVWVACNTDATLPTERGPLPGNGAMVAAVKLASGREPQVAGKPSPRLFREALERSGGRSGLVVGDRLDTDIEGGHAVGLPTLLVLTGVSDATDVLWAAPARRPDHIAADLAGLTRPVDELTPGPRPGWRVEHGGGFLVLAGDGAGSPEPVLDALRALCATHWAGNGGQISVRAQGGPATRVVTELGLPVGAAR